MTTPDINDASLQLTGSMVSAATQRTEIIFVEQNIEGYQQLVDSVRAGTEVYLLDPDQDGLAQIAGVLAGRSGVDAIHVVSHGAEASVALGRANLTTETLASHADELATIKSALTADGDFLLYGCNVGRGERGAELIKQLSLLTGADVAASEDNTGASVLNGNWVLERQVGAIDAASPFDASAVSSFQGVLVAPSDENFESHTANPGVAVTTLAGFTYSMDSGGLYTVQNQTHAVTHVGSGNYLYVNAGESSGPSYFEIRSTSLLDNFKLVSMAIESAYALSFGPGGNGPEVYTVTGYDGGSGTTAVITETFDMYQSDSAGTITFTGNGGAGYGTLTFGTAWQNIDTIRFTLAGSAPWAAIDNIDISSAVVPDTTPPTATIGLSDSALKIGDTSTVTITFSEAVSGFSNADLTVASGALTTAVSSSDGGITWTATFTPTADISDTTNVITLNKAGVQDFAGNAGVGTTDSGNYTVDTARPTATITLDDSALKVGETAAVTITFSEAVTGFTNADLTIASGTLTPVSSSDGGTTWTATFTPSVDLNDATNTITVANTGVLDAAGNAGSGTTDSGNYTINTVRPTVTVGLSDSALKAGDTATVTFTFSEAVTGFTNADVTAANGTLTAVSSSDGGTTWTATFTPTAALLDVTNLITVDKTGVTNAAGNAGSGTTDSSNYTIDTELPTATITLDDSALKAGETAAVTITLSEAVTGFTNADLTIDNGTLSAVSTSDGGITWTATFTPTASITVASNTISLNNTGVQDGAGNAGSGSTSSANYAIDTVLPTVTVALADSTLIAGETTLVTFTFSEAVTGFTNADLTIANGALTAVASSDGGTTWTATFTPSVDLNDATNTITIANTGVLDAAGNVGSGTTDSGNYTINTVRPTVTVGLSDSALKAGDTATVTFTFSEAVTGFSNDDVTAANGTLTAVSSSDGGTTWTATFTPTTALLDVTNVITVDKTGVANAAGNAGSGTTDSSNYTIDTALPTATITLDDSALKAGETAAVTITFSEAVIDFTNADLTIDNGTLSAVSTSDGGITWTATFTPTASITDASNTIALANAGVQDGAGNTGSGSTSSANYAVDTARPTVAVTLADSTLIAGETTLVTFTFSEAVTGFTNDDLTIANGALTAVASSDGGTTWTATFTPSVDLNDATNTITIANTGVLDAAGNAGSGTTDSGNYTINTVRPTVTVGLSDSALKAGDTATVTFTFSEAVTGFSNDDVTAANGTLTAVSSSDGGTTWTATFTPTTALLDATNVITVDKTGVTNAAGNAGSGSTSSGNYTIDTALPTATITLDDSALKAGETAAVTITFSEAVIDFTNADLTIDNGTLSAVSTSDGGITWTATFTPTASITDASNTIALANAGVQDGAGNTGSGSTSSANYAVDTARPTVAVTLADSTLIAGETTLVTFTFSEAVTGFTNADLTIANGALTAVASSDGGTTWTATFTPSVDLNDATNTITIANTGVLDAAGNVGSGTTDSGNYTINTVRPTVTVGLSDSALKAGDTATVTFTFSEAVTDFTNADLTVDNGTLTAVSSSDGGITWTATFTPTASITDTSNTIALANSGVQDSAGNAGSGSTSSANYAIDTALPTVTVALADTTLIAGETTLVTFTFSEAVTGFTNADLTIANGALTAVASSDGGTTWTASFTPSVDVADATNVITVANTGVLDAAGNTGSGTTDSANYTINTVIPTVTIGLSDSALKAGETSTVTFTFSEAVAGFTNADVTVANGTLTAVASSDGGTTWTATFTPTADVLDATNLITVDKTGVANAAGNAGSGTTDSANYTIDTAPPTAIITLNDSALKAGETAAVTIAFSEAVTDFTNADLTVDNGTLTAVSSSDGGITWTATFTPTASITDASNTISLANTGVQDSAGNTGSGSTSSANYAIDTALPTVTVALADTTLIAGDTTLVTFTFSEAVTGFTNADLTIANGALTAVASSDGGTTWTASFTPSVDVADATNVITVANTGVLDAAGNAGSGTTDSANYTINTVIPTVTIGLSDSALKAGETSTVTFTFSEAVTGFSNDDVTVANGTLTAVSSSDGGTTWTATFTPTADVLDATNLITVDKSGVANAAGNAGSGSTSSVNYTIDTARPTATITLDDSALMVGETAALTIIFSEAVTGFTNADLTIDNGTLSAVSSSDGGTTWTATFTPTASITDTSNTISLDNTGVQDSAGNTGSGSTSSANYAVDTARPTVTVTLADSTLVAGDTTLVTITFSEAVTGFTNADLTIANGALTAVASSDGGTSWTATFTPSVDVADATNTITVANTGVLDAAGNAGSGTTDSGNYTINTVIPTVTVGMSDTVLKAGETAVVTFTFSEAVSGFTNADVTVANGTLTAVSSSDGGVTWSATFTPAADLTDTSNLISVAAAGVVNGAGNAGTGQSDSPNYTIDTDRPDATLALADSALAAGETALLTITFDQAVTGLTAAAITGQNGSIAGLASSDGGTTWTATLTPSAATADASNVVSVDLSSVTDASGNAGTGSASSANYAVDTVRPSASVVVADTSLLAGETSLVTITFSQAVSGLTGADFSVANGSLSGLASTDGGTTWSATLTPAEGVNDTSNLITLDNTAYATGAGNTGLGSTNSNNYALETTRPTASIVVGDNLLGIGETTTVTITFSEAVSGFTNADLTVGAGTLSAVSSSDGGITWVATLTPTDAISSASNVITLNNTGVQDAAGNSGTATTVSNNYAVATEPVPSGTVDGVPVFVDIVVDPDTGLENTVVTIQAIPVNRNEDPNTPNGSLADIPLGIVTPPGSPDVDLVVSLPAGTGLTAEGPNTLLSNEDTLLDLIRRIEDKTQLGSAIQQEMRAQGVGFLGSIGGAVLIETKTLVPTVESGTTLTQPIIVTGSSSTPPAGGQNPSAIALVIDATKLPADAVLHLNNIDFAAIVGNTTLRGGDGENFVIGDGGAQNIFLGADDDKLYGGAGNDIVGSAAGNDLLDGGAGDDIVVGGIGNDSLAGGSGSDLLQGGRSDQGGWQFYLDAAGNIKARHALAVFAPGSTETLGANELDHGAAGLGFLDASAQRLSDLGLLYRAVFGRAPDLGGLDYWIASGGTIADIAKAFGGAAEWAAAGYDQLDHAGFVGKLYQNVLGRQPDAAGAAYWIEKLAGTPGTAALSRAEVMVGIAVSNEHTAAATTADGLLIGSGVRAGETAWIAGGGDDRLDGGLGSDILVGGDGADTIAYAGASTNYAILLGEDGKVKVLDKANGDLDILSGIEAGSFTDGTANLVFTQATAASLQHSGLLYQTLFDRAGDLAGMGWWAGKHDDAGTAVRDFMSTPEYAARYATMGDAQFIQALYQNTGLQATDANGVQTWESFAAGHTRAELIGAWIGNASVIDALYGTQGLWIA